MAVGSYWQKKQTTPQDKQKSNYMARVQLYDGHYSTCIRVLTRILKTGFIESMHPWKKLESKLKNWSLTLKSWSF